MHPSTIYTLDSFLIVLFVTITSLPLGVCAVLLSFRDLRERKYENTQSWYIKMSYAQLQIEIEGHVYLNYYQLSL